MKSSISCASSLISNGPVANRMGRSNNNAFIDDSFSLKSDHVGHVLISGMLLGMGAFPALQIPDFETAAAADERDLAFQLEPFAKIVRQEEATLFVGGAVLGAGMELSQVNAQIARRNSGHAFGRGADARELVRRHDEQELPARFRDDQELFALAVAPPARGNGDAMFVIELMTKFSRVEI